MARVLGISAHHRDASAALVVDGSFVAALQEERLSRVKDDRGLPLRAARSCLELGGVRPEDLDEVVFNAAPKMGLERLLPAHLRQFPQGALGWPRLLAASWTENLHVQGALAEALGIPRKRVTSRHHHDSQAASAFFLSPFQRAAVLIVGGAGETATTGIYLGEGSKLEFLESLEFPHSLGLLHAALMAYLGFDRADGEHQAMDLAAYGKPRYIDKFARVLRNHPDGSFELRPEFLDLSYDAEFPFSPLLERIFGPARSYHRELGPFAEGSFEDPESQRFADIAASFQATLERTLLGLARRVRAKTGATELCLAGGMALNAVAQARLLKDAGFEHIFVQATGEAGGAMGAALLGALGQGDPRPLPLSSLALGLPLARTRAREIALAMALEVSELSDPYLEAAQRIAGGQIVALAQGRSELGPQAFGQRCILCRPDSLELKQRVDEAIQSQEHFRPFEAAVLETQVAEYFEVQPKSMCPFTMNVVPVRFRRLPGVTHVDGTARIHRIAPGDALSPLLRALADQGLPPVVLATSMNASGEPIAATEADVLAFFASSALDALVLEDLLIQKPASA